MWDLLCKLVSKELFNARFPKDNTVKHIRLTHNNIEEAGSVNNTLYHLFRAEERFGILKGSRIRV
jgi:hypothetical protein